MLSENLTVYDFMFFAILAIVAVVAFLCYRKGYSNGYEDGREAEKRRKKRSEKSVKTVSSDIPKDDKKPTGHSSVEIVGRRRGRGIS